MARRKVELRYKYPLCPNCGAGNGNGHKGFKIDKLGNSYRIHGKQVENHCLRCRSCNAMFTFKFDENCNVILLKSLGGKDEKITINNI